MRRYDIIDEKAREQENRMGRGVLDEKASEKGASEGVYIQYFNIVLYHIIG